MSAPLHAAVVALVTLVASDPVARLTGGGEAGGEVAVAFVAAATDFTLPTPTATSSSGDDMRPDTPPDVREAPDKVDLGFAGYNFDIAKIRARKESLFPFLTADLMFLGTISEQATGKNRRLVNPFATAAAGPPGDTLALADQDLQQIVDEAWSRRERWTRFSRIAGLVQEHGAAGGRVADVLRAYLDQNILQPYCEWGRVPRATAPPVRDPMLWVMLENASDHADFIEFIRTSVREHPRSRATTELLFLADELTQASRDALLILLDTNGTRDLRRTFDANREAFWLVADIQKSYRDWLSERRLESGAAIKDRYDAIRLHILTTIIETTPEGYRAADARFLAGEIYFAHGNLDEALRLWREVRPVAGDSYTPAYSQVLDRIRSGREVAAVDIQRILDRERARWWDLSYQRLRRFGFACDSF